MLAYLNVIDLFWFLSVCVIVLGIAWVGSAFIVPVFLLLFAIPFVFWEIVLWLGSFGLIYNGVHSHPKWTLEPEDHRIYSSFYTSLLGCLLMIPASAFSLCLHGNRYSKHKYAVFSCMALMVGTSWALVDLVHESTLLGFLSVMALQTGLGFSIVSVPLGYTIGFRDDDAMSRTMSSSLVMLTFYCFINMITNPDYAAPAFFAYFEYGTLVCGGFVFAIGCLITSSRLYYDPWATRHSSYFIRNLGAIVFYLLALVLGTLFPNLVELRRIGASFLALYALEKYVELPWDNEAYGFATLFGGVLLYCMCYIASKNPEYFFLLR